MKKLLTVCLFAVGAVAFAGNNDNTEPTAGNEKNATVTTTAAKKALAKIPAAHEAKAKPVPTRAVCTTCSNDARFNVSGYFAEFVNRNNLKLVKMLLD